jgi:LemA protein
MAILVLLGIVVLVVLWAIGAYNSLVALKNRAEAAWNQIDVQLKRRHDLVPNLVETVRGYAQQEQTIFTAVADARARLGGAVQSGNLQQMSEANQGLTGALGRLLAISENYPQLKSNENFRALQDQLEGTENRISTARGDYNSAVQTYNSYIRLFPQVLTAKVIGSKERAYFQVTNAAAKDAPAVDFSKKAP